MIWCALYVKFKEVVRFLARLSLSASGTNDRHWSKFVTPHSHHRIGFSLNSSFSREGLPNSLRAWPQRTLGNEPESFHRVTRVAAAARLRHSRGPFGLNCFEKQLAE